MGLPLLVEVRERLATGLAVLLEVEVGAVRDALELAPADRELVVDVGGPLGVVGELALLVLAQPEVLAADTVALVPGESLLDPALMPHLVGRPTIDRIVRVDEELDLHLLELVRPEDEVPGRDLVTEGLPDLGDPERELEAHRLEHVVEVDEDALRRLGPEVGDRRVLLDRTHEGLEHEVELARRGQLPLAALRAQRAPRAAVPAGLARGHRELVALRRRAVVRPRLCVELIGAEPPAAGPAVHHGIGEVVEVAARLPHGGMHEDRGVEADHVGAEGHIVAPPRPLDVALELDAQRPVVPARGDAAVDLARLEDETPPLAQRDDDVHVHRHASSAVFTRVLPPWARAA